MAAQNQKKKILCLMKILLECTDEKHPMKANELCDALKSYGISAERKSIYDGEWSDRRTKWLLQSYDIRLVRD